MTRLLRISSRVSSKQEIVNLGIPPVAADILYDKVDPKHANLIAKWIRDYYGYKGKGWWSKVGYGDQTIGELTDMYEKASDVDTYRKYLEFEGYEIPEDLNENYLEDQRRSLKVQIKWSFEDLIIFKNNLVKAVVSGELKDVAPYKNLPLKEATEKYEKKKIFEDVRPLKVYEDGFRWVDAGRKCQLLADQMSNCGSAGLMSMDPNATILSLFDSNLKPHVMVTYSPKEKRLSGVEGAASTAVKPEYHNYVLDLVQHLGARLDSDKSKSLKLKYELPQYEIIPREDLSEETYSELYELRGGGESYITDSFNVITKSKAESYVKGELEGAFRLPTIGNLFHPKNREVLGLTPIRDFVAGSVS